MPSFSVEEIIRRAIEEGEFDDLPGKGKPLVIVDNPHQDPGWWAAHHILKSSGFSLPWIEALRVIDINLQRARDQLAPAESDGRPAQSGQFSRWPARPSQSRPATAAPHGREITYRRHV